MENYTFSTKGLDREEIQFLQICEEMYFEEVVVDKHFLTKAVNKSSYEIGQVPKKIIDIFDYWQTLNGRFRLHRQSLKEPMLLSKVITRQTDRGMRLSTRASINLISKDGTFHLRGQAGNERIIWNCHPYLEIIETNSGELNLHLKYNKIIGGFFIAKLKKDQNFIV
jgi:hypothetical protein